jgi:acylglycerol lipase
MKRFFVILAALMLTACTPLVVQQAGVPGASFQGPRIEADSVVSFDGARLGLTRWEAAGEPWAVVVALHGMNDYANAFHFAAPVWAEQGVTTYAYDQRGFGRSPMRGIWGGRELMDEDLRTVVSLVRGRYPQALVAVVGESMGGSVALETFASERPPAADRLVVLSPGVWGWSTQPLPNKTLLWLAARFTGPKIYTPPDWVTKKIHPTDNREELIAMGRDPLMVWGARSDTLYGLVSLMQRASEATGQAPVPTFYLYGAHDQVIPKKAARRAARQLKPTDRSAYYADGYHLLIRDHQRAVVIADILAFLRDPNAPLPSGAPTIPGAPTRGNDARATATVATGRQAGPP